MAIEGNVAKLAQFFEQTSTQAAPVPREQSAVDGRSSRAGTATLGTSRSSTASTTTPASRPPANTAASEMAKNQAIIAKQMTWTAVQRPTPQAKVPAGRFKIGQHRAGASSAPPARPTLTQNRPSVTQSLTEQNGAQKPVIGQHRPSQSVSPEQMMLDIKNSRLSGMLKGPKAALGNTLMNPHQESQAPAPPPTPRPASESDKSSTPSKTSSSSSSSRSQSTTSRPKTSMRERVATIKGSSTQTAATLKTRAHTVLTNVKNAVIDKCNVLSQSLKNAPPAAKPVDIAETLSPSNLPIETEKLVDISEALPLSQLQVAIDTSYKTPQEFSHQLQRDLSKRSEININNEGQLSVCNFQCEEVNNKFQTGEVTYSDNKSVANAMIPPEVKGLGPQEPMHLVAYLASATESRETFGWLLINKDSLLQGQKGIEPDADIILIPPHDPKDTKITISIENGEKFLEKQEKYTLGDMNKDGKPVKTIEVTRCFNLSQLDKPPACTVKLSDAE